MARSDESAVCAQITAVAVSLSQSLVEDVVYTLSQLRMQHSKLKEEQQRVIEAICHGDDVFVSLPILFFFSRSIKYTVSEGIEMPITTLHHVVNILNNTTIGFKCNFDLLGPNTHLLHSVTSYS